MIVEFVGAPGSGKTTIIEQAAPELGYSVVDMVNGDGPDGKHPSKQARRIQWARALVRNPRLTAGWISSVQCRDRNMIRHALEASRRDWLLRNTDSSCSILVDEGPLHRLLWVLSWSGWNGDLARFGIPAADLVLFVPTPAKTAFERVTGRGGSNTVLALPDDERLRALVRYQDFAARLGATEVTDTPTAVRAVRRFATELHA